MTDTVGHVVREYLPRSATFIHTLLRAQRGFQPVVLAKHTMNAGEFPAERVHELAGKTTLARRARRRAATAVSRYPGTYERGIAEVARRERCAVLHAHFGWSAESAVPAAVRMDLPLVTTFYGRDVTDPERGRSYAGVFEAGARFICEGPAMAERLRENGCPGDRTRIVRIGIDLAQWPFRPPRRSEPLVIVQASRLVEKKGVDLSLRAFAAARPRLGPSELWLVGDGPLRDELGALADRLGLAASVRFVGMLSYREYREMLAHAHLCLQPSRTASDGDTEGGAPTVLLEMYAAGIPVVTTLHADIPFVATDPDDLVEEEDVDGIADALVDVARRHEEERLARARRARAVVEERHAADVVAAEIEAIYREAMCERA